MSIMPTSSPHRKKHGLPFKISASLMCANLGRLEEEVRILEETGIDLIHFDVMDGHFVPNLALSPLILKAIKNKTSLPFDVHLMVTNPELYLLQLFELKVEYITLHVETIYNSGTRLLREIKNHGVLCGIALNPLTPISYVKYIYPYVDKITLMTVDPGFSGQPFITTILNKIKRLANFRRRNKLSFDIEVDGSINSATFEHVLAAGANILVVGESGLFSRHENHELAAQLLLDELKHIWEKIQQSTCTKE